MANENKPRVVHMASKMSSKGGVSPLCAPSPRAINLKVASWTLTRNFVTCKHCLKMFDEMKAKA